MRLRRLTLASIVICLRALAQEAPAVPLAERLVGALPEERRVLIEANSSAITPDLVREIRKFSISFDAKGKYPEGLKVEQLALTLAERVGDLELQETALHGMGYYYSQIGRLEQSVESYKRAIAIAEELKNGIRVARHSLELSATLANQGEYDEGLRYASKALELAVVAGSSTEEARARNALGKSHAEAGRFSEAANQYLKALEIAEREHLGTGIAYLANNLGSIYTDQGNFPLALHYLQRSLKIKEELKDPNLSTTLSNLGTVYQALGHNAEALESVDRALRLSRELGKQPKVAESLMMLAKLERNQAKYRNALMHLKEAEQITVEIKAGDLRMQVLTEKALTELAEGSPKQALETSLQIEASARELHNDAHLGRALRIAGDSALRIGQRESARAYYLEAIRSFDRLREQAAGGAEDRELFYEELLSPYQGIARIDADQGRIASAFEFADRAKARVLAEILESGHTSVTRSMTEKERTQEKSLRSILLHAPEGKARDSARLDYQAFQNALYSRHPELRRQRGQSAPLPASSAIAVLPDNKTVLLQFLVTPEETLMFTVSRNRGIRLFRIRVSEPHLRKLVETYRDLVARRDLGYEGPARELYQLVIAPAEAELIGKTSIAILPDGLLWQVPFQTLTASDGRFLSEIYQVSYAPSIAVLASLAQNKKPAATGLRLLAMAQGLPEAEEEARALGSLYGASAVVYTGEAAREAVFKAQAPEFGILHLASHGVLEGSSPMYSYVALAKDSLEDGHLEAAELMNMDLKARLVVLSACDTAQGRIGAGEGVVGLTWALAVAGVPTTVASNWKVDSKATTELMVEFHRGLLGGSSPAAALQQSAMKLMAQPKYHHPFYWGSFAVFGLGWY